MKMRNSKDRSQVPALLRDLLVDLAGGTKKTNTISPAMIPHLKGLGLAPELSRRGAGCAPPGITQLFVRVHAAKARDCESSRLVQSQQLLPNGTALLVVAEEHVSYGEVVNRG